MNMTLLETACRDFRKLTGKWPTNTAQLRAAVPVPFPTTFTDGWNNPIVFVYHTNEPNTIWLESYGADGTPGGVGENADVVTALRP